MRFLSEFKYFLENQLVLAAISSFFFAQLVKVAIALARRGTDPAAQKNNRELVVIFFWRTGGMPSSHAALVGSLVTSIAILEGPSSNIFFVTLFFSLIVLRDAVGVRHASGMQARALNLLGRKAADLLPIQYHPVKEVQGHTPLEVLVGCLLGIFISAAYAYL
jgi:acid phosphatase family membrane protein YuiD